MGRGSLGGDRLTNHYKATENRPKPTQNWKDRVVSLKATSFSKVNWPLALGRSISVFHLGYIASGLFEPNWQWDFGDIIDYWLPLPVGIIFKTSIPMIFLWNHEPVFRLVFNILSPSYAFLSWYSVGRWSADRTWHWQCVQGHKERFIFFSQKKRLVALWDRFCYVYRLTRVQLNSLW